MNDNNKSRLYVKDHWYTKEYNKQNNKILLASYRICIIPLLKPILWTLKKDI